MLRTDIESSHAGTQYAAEMSVEFDLVDTQVDPRLVSEIDLHAHPASEPEWDCAGRIAPGQESSFHGGPEVHRREASEARGLALDRPPDQSAGRGSDYDPFCRRCSYLAPTVAL
jgi:hypothetical protein